jgi:hypothetical protein
VAGRDVRVTLDVTSRREDFEPPLGDEILGRRAGRRGGRREVGERRVGREVMKWGEPM